MVGFDVQALVSSRPGYAGWRPLRSLRWWRQSQHAGDIAAELSLCAIERARAVDNSSLPTGGAGTLAGGSAPVPAPTGPTVSPPSTIAANCSVDVSKPLRKWLKALPAGSTVVAPTNACRFGRPRIESEGSEEPHHLWRDIRGQGRSTSCGGGGCIPSANLCGGADHQVRTDTGAGIGGGHTRRHGQGHWSARTHVRVHRARR